MRQKINAGRRAVLIGLGLSALAACSPPGAPARGQRLAQASGGSSDRPSEGGVGGTGIIGLVHGTASLRVNGLTIETPPGLAVRHALGTLPLSAVGPGQAVTIEAAAGPDGGLVAAGVTVVHPLVGRIESLTDDGFRCLGVDVLVERGAPLTGPRGRFQPAPGQRVAVSGLWRGNSVVAARVDLLSAISLDDVVAGVALAGGTRDRLRLGGLDLVLPPGTAVPQAGGFVTAVGRRRGDLLIADRIATGRFRGLAGPLERLSVEGYLEPQPAPPGYAVSGLGHSFDEAARLDALAGERAVFIGPYDGAFRVARGLPLPEGVAERDVVLAAVEDGFAPEAAVVTR
ncbi:DUF5666 domain-containing protein [Pelagibius sp.]|uniref:DUF5666 domain-containing protein n=1 Tax=Pelagibius sp. TaxID=1931238 RepID=UPI003B5074E7